MAAHDLASHFSDRSSCGGGVWNRVGGGGPASLFQGYSLETGFDHRPFGCRGRGGLHRPRSQLHLAIALRSLTSLSMRSTFTSLFQIRSGEGRSTLLLILVMLLLTMGGSIGSPGNKCAFLGSGWSRVPPLHVYCTCWPDGRDHASAHRAPGPTFQKAPLPDLAHSAWSVSSWGAVHDRPRS